MSLQCLAASVSCRPGDHQENQTGTKGSIAESFGHLHYRGLILFKRDQPNLADTLLLRYKVFEDKVQ